MVVEDDAEVRQLTCTILRRAGYTILEARDVHHAIELFRSNKDRIGLVLTDLVMPGMNGDELARRLREMDPSLKVLYLTGFSERLFKERVTLSEGEAFLDKPCTVKALLQAVSLLAYGRFVDPPFSTAQR